MTVSKRNSLFAVNVIVPLVCGLFIFLTKTENIYLSDSLRGVRSVLPVIRYPKIINFFAVVFEILQLNQRFPGTFDPRDIVVDPYEIDPSEPIGGLMDDISVGDAEYPFTLEQTGTNKFIFDCPKLGKTTATYDPLTGTLSVDPITTTDKGVKATISFDLNCYYYDDSMSAVVITGTAFFDFAGDYKGMYFDGDFSGSRELPYREASVPATVSEEWGEGFEEDWGDGGEEDWDPELWDEIENGGGGDDWED